MPTARNGSVELYYDVDGSGKTVLFLGDLGYGAWQWGWQHAAVAGPCESLVTDLRGVGRSAAPPGPYSVEQLAADARAVLERHGTHRVHLVGAGLGGMVALELTLTGGRARSLTLIGTAAHGAGIDPEPLFGDPEDRAQLRSSLSAALSSGFRDSRPDVVNRIVSWRAEEDATRTAWAAQRDALEAFDRRDSLHEITIPALVIHGTDDSVWPIDRGQRLADRLPRGEFHFADGAGHLPHVEHSRVVNDELLGHLDDDL